jgi:SRSO17 transposase
VKILHIFLCLGFICFSLFAASDKFSQIPLPQGVFLNIDERTCNNTCLEKLLRNEAIFSFLSKYNDEYSTKHTQENYLIYGQMFNVFFDIDLKTIKIAVLVPQKTIKSHAIASVNAVAAYLLRQSNNFELEVFNSGDESKGALIQKLTEIRKNGYSHVIAPITQNGVRTLFENSDGLYIFIPTLHKSLFEDAPNNIFFGGIDYSAQIAALSSFSNGYAVAISDDTQLGLVLNKMIEENDKVLLEETVFTSVKDDLKKYFTDNENLNGSSVYLNTRPVMTSLLASQLRIYKYSPFALLSTQANYQPALLALSQYEDRKNLYLANSIGKIDDELNSINSFFGNNLEYEYVNYAVSIGVEYFSERFFSQKTEQLFKESIEENGQVLYDTKIYKTGRYGFLPQAIVPNIQNITDEID